MTGMWMIGTRASGLNVWAVRLVGVGVAVLVGVIVLGSMSGAAVQGVAQPDDTWWADRELVMPVLPSVDDGDWSVNAIDRFVLARLEGASMTPAGDASRRSLIRRATYDLIGLPPTPEEVAAFVEDDSPSAYSALVERLLASEQYGVKWGRHWLDLVRYAETDGYERDRVKPGVWRYRDYVVEAFNSDKPYDEFVVEQLAGDEIDRPTLQTMVATGYYHLGIRDDEPTDTLLAQYDDLDGVLDTTSRVMLGVSMGCARCHDHKGDPIGIEEYYGMLSFFRGVKPYKEGGGNNVTPDNFVKKVREDLGIEDEAGSDTGTGKLRSLLRAEPVEYEVLCVMEDGPTPQETRVLNRGNPHVPEGLVEPGVPAMIASHPVEFEVPAEGAASSGRRLALANWITDKRNRRTARVMMNRVWQYHFGRGLVRSPNDFGSFGFEPTHPELLDYLAVEFMERNWSVKEMHRLIMMSRTYRMSSDENAEAMAVDPMNDLMWRFDMRRLTAEEIRDSVLSVNGSLNLEIGGPSVYPPMPREVLETASRPGDAWGRSSEEQANRRSIYIHVKRSLLSPMLTSFDMADTDSTCPVRFTTTQPTQALTMLNSEFAHAQSAVFADRLRAEAGADDEARVRLGLSLVLCRQPTAGEIARGVELVVELRLDPDVAGDKVLDYYCLVLLNLNEFVYLD